MWITPETRKLCPFTKFSWSYPYFNILNEKSLGTQHRISAVENSTHNQHMLRIVQCHHFDHISTVNGDDHFFFKPGVVVLMIIGRHVAPRYSELARIPACLHSAGSGFREKHFD